MANPKGKLNSI
jgi:hypothetical protein